MPLAYKAMVDALSGDGENAGGAAGLIVAYGVARVGARCLRSCAT